MPATTTVSVASIRHAIAERKFDGDVTRAGKYLRGRLRANGDVAMKDKELRAAKEAANDNNRWGLNMSRATAEEIFPQYVK